MIVHAEVHSDDGRDSAAFDAAPWLDQATINQVAMLREDEWCKCEAADFVMQWVREHGSAEDRADLTEFSNYCKDMDCGYEVFINGDEAEKWLERQKGVVAARNAVDYLLGQ